MPRKDTEQTLRKILVAALDNPLGSRAEWAEAAGIGKRQSENIWADPEKKQWIQDRMVLSLGDRVYQLLTKILDDAIAEGATAIDKKLAVEVVEKFKLTGLTAAAQSRAPGPQIVLNFTGDGRSLLPPEPRARDIGRLPPPKDDDADE